ncbi:HP1 family phage holin [Pseudomonas leptonychotis]|uniref:HP1 family phage holin n=1 Tax=Pseudomonas leptonychotis TaxID=2448482 RepID=UPI003864F399
MSNTADKVMNAASYAGGFFSVAAGLTLTEWGVIVGIVTALLTFLASQLWQVRKYRMDLRIQEAADARAQRIYDLEVQRLCRQLPGANACELHVVGEE